MSDIFISYAHADDEIPLGASKGWVTTFAEELNKLLRRKLGGRGASIWMDHQLAANESHTESLLRELRDSRLLLVVMSPGYERSWWCQREIHNFVADSRARGLTDNVFIVELEPPISRASWDASLRYVRTIPFWRREFEDSAPRLLGYPVPSADEHNPYWVNLTELAHAIDRYLRREPETAIEARPTVFLAESSDDLLDERAATEAFLTQQGFEVLPAVPLPLESDRAFAESVAHSLAHADIFAQRLGPWEGRRAPASDMSFVILQAVLAARARAQGRLRVVQWRTPNVVLGEVASEAYRALLSGIPAGGAEEFKREVVAAMARPAALPPVETRAIAARNDELSVYVNADPVDRSVADWAFDALVPLGAAAVIAPDPDVRQSPDEIRLAQHEQLERCDGVLLVYGQTPDTWLQSQFAVASRVVGLRRQGVWGAVLDAAPVSRRSAPIRSRNLINLNCRAGLDTDMLARFVAALRGGDAAPAHA